MRSVSARASGADRADIDGSEFHASISSYQLRLMVQDIFLSPQIAGNKMPSRVDCGSSRLLSHCRSVALPLDMLKPELGFREHGRGLRSAPSETLYQSSFLDDQSGD